MTDIPAKLDITVGVTRNALRSARRALELLEYAHGSAAQLGDVERVDALTVTHAALVAAIRTFPMWCIA